MDDGAHLLDDECLEHDSTAEINPLDLDDSSSESELSFRMGTKWPNSWTFSDLWRFLIGQTLSVHNYLNQLQNYDNHNPDQLTIWDNRFRTYRRRRRIARILFEFNLMLEKSSQNLLYLMYGCLGYCVRWTPDVDGLLFAQKLEWWCQKAWFQINQK